MMDESTNQKPYLSNHHYTLELNLAAIWLKVKNNNVITECIVISNSAKYCTFTSIDLNCTIDLSVGR